MLGLWSRGMMLALGARGREFDSPKSPNDIKKISLHEHIKPYKLILGYDKYITYVCCYAHDAEQYK
jgi:hypothetical protein